MKNELFGVSKPLFWGAGMALVAAFAFTGISACRTRTFGTLPASGASAPADANALEAFYKEFPAGATHDVDSSFEAAVEFDTTRPACDRHFARLDPQGLILPEHAASAQARADLLLCGKHLFFHSESSMTLQ